MGLFSTLFGGGALKQKAAVKATSLGLSFIDIPTGSFYGQCQTSENAQFTIAWRDTNDQGTQGGARTQGKGRYLLLDGKTILVEGRMERPNDGKVANNGSFVLNDWRYFTNQLRGTFYAFRADGTEILRRRFKANLYNNGLSPDGAYACCQTCNSPDASDSSVLAIFDLVNRAEIASWCPESGWASNYEFTEDSRYILLSYPEGPPLRYTLAGEFVDRNLWIESSLDRGDLYMIDRVMKETHPKPEGPFARRLLECIDKGLSKTRSDDPRTRAWALKLKGMCFDGLEEFGPALGCYEEGIALDPKLGVKRRIAQLRKKLNGLDSGAV